MFALFTYVYRASPTSPYLRFAGPTGSAKTRSLELLNQVAFRPVISCSMSPATLFRLIDQHGGLVLIDEAEHLANSRNGASGILPILLSGYKDTGRLHRTMGNRVSFFSHVRPEGVCRHWREPSYAGEPVDHRPDVPGQHTDCGPTSR